MEPFFHAGSPGNPPENPTRKYEAITGAGIKVMKRVDLPDDFIKDTRVRESRWMTTFGWPDIMGILTGTPPRDPTPPKK